MPQKRLSVPVPVLNNDPLLQKGRSIDLDSFKEEPIKDGQESPDKKEPNIASQVMAAIPEDEKDSNFGDYGEESEDEDSDD